MIEGRSDTATRACFLFSSHHIPSIKRSSKFYRLTLSSPWPRRTLPKRSWRNLSQKKRKYFTHSPAKQDNWLAPNSAKANWQKQLPNATGSSRLKVRILSPTWLSHEKLIACLTTADVYSFFYHAMPPDDGVLSLEEVHDIVKNIWLTRHDIELEAEQTARRKGRSKSVKELKLEEIKLREAEEYRTGMG